MRSYLIPKSYINSSFSYNINITNDPEYITKLRSKLNSTRDLLNNIYNDKAYISVSKILDHCRYIRGVIRSSYNAQNPSNSWLKMYEMLSYYNLLDNTSRYYFANCEMPGSFIFAFNHYNNTVLSGNVEWYGSSILAYCKDNSYLNDRYQLYDKYPDRWTMDKYNNGDTTKLSNIVDVTIKILQKTGGKLIDLYTSDGALDMSSDYNNQESMSYILLIGEVVMALHILGKGGNMVVKTFTFLEHLSLSLIKILSSIFEELYICKPMSSRSSNSEVYLVGKGFKGCPIWIRSLLINRLNKKSKEPLISAEHIYDDLVFMDAIYKSYAIFWYQITSLENHVRLYYKYRYKIHKLEYLCRDDINISIRRYINNTKIQRINNSKKIKCREIKF